MTHPSNTSEAPWEACPPDALAALPGALRRAERRQFLVQMSTLGGTAAAATAAVWLAWPLPVLECHEVVALADDYLAQRLSSTQLAAVERHLQHCDHCREHLAQLRAT